LTELQIAKAEPAMASLVRTALAKRIIETAQRPGIDMQTLRDDGLPMSKTTCSGPLLVIDIIPRRVGLVIVLD
jgi:hypothetical protein